MQTLCLTDIDGHPFSGRDLPGKDVNSRDILECRSNRKNPVFVFFSRCAWPHDYLFSHCHSPFVASNRFFCVLCKKNVLPEFISLFCRDVFETGYINRTLAFLTILHIRKFITDRMKTSRNRYFCLNIRMIRSIESERACAC